ncbi:MAG TPA: organomercurial lyase [Jatrophihabitantaceae bacterium]|jgi:hypothetical protein
MKVQILHVPDCPNTAVLAARLDEVLDGQTDAEVEVEERVIADHGEAVAAGMTGSPTLLVDGSDPFAVPGASASMSCRLYRDLTGAATGSPSIAALRAVLAGQAPATGTPDGSTLAGWRATGGRQALLPGALRGLHQGVLRHFLTYGQAPDRARIQKQAAELGLDADRAIRQLTAADLVHLGADGVVSVAYPFSGVPRGHQVQLVGGPAVWAMCAIDALGIPQMAERDTIVTAADPSDGGAVIVQARAGRWHWAPASTVVLVARTGANGPSMECTCDHINFYSHAEHAQAYLDEHPELTGQILDHDTAIERAGQAFGGLLHDPEPTDPEAPTAATGGPSQ